MQAQLTEHYKDPCSTKRKMVLTAWVATNLSIFPFFISVCVAMNLLSSDGHGGGVSFSLFWTFCHTIGLLVVGTYTLTKRLTPITYGMLSCGCLMMGSWMLQTCIVIGQYNCVQSNETTSTTSSFSDCVSSNNNPDAIRSTIAFGVFLFLGYIITGVMLLVFKRDLALSVSGESDSRVFLSEQPTSSATAIDSAEKYDIEDGDDEEEIIPARGTSV